MMFQVIRRYIDQRELLQAEGSTSGVKVTAFYALSELLLSLETPTLRRVFFRSICIFAAAHMWVSTGVKIITLYTSPYQFAVYQSKVAFPSLFKEPLKQMLSIQIEK